MRKVHDRLVFSPSDLVTFLSSPFASWMDRFHLENPGRLTPDAKTADQQLVADAGSAHEQRILKQLRDTCPTLIEVPHHPVDVARETTRKALDRGVPAIYQAYLEHDSFAGFADFLKRDEHGEYQVWDTKLARKPKPYYAIQLCCYAEMLAASRGGRMSTRFGVILGDETKQEFLIEDFLHYYRRVKADFLALQADFTGNLADRPEPQPRADHGRWTSHATQYFEENDHLVQVAGISVGQIRKLKAGGVTTMAELARAGSRTIPKLAAETLQRLAAQARLQCSTHKARIQQPEAPADIELLPVTEAGDQLRGLAALPPDDAADVFFDMEGYPLAPGGLEYLFGACTHPKGEQPPPFHDWWAHDRDEEKLAFEGFIDWAHARWKQSSKMHIYHYAAYEVSAVRRLSTRHDTRQEQADELLRNEVFVDLYQVVRQGLLVGEDSYSIKAIERLYRPKRITEVATAVGSVVQYAAWMESGEPRDWKGSALLKAIRDYNEDDCRSTVELLRWLRELAKENGIPPAPARRRRMKGDEEPKDPNPEIAERQELAERLRAKKDAVSRTLGDLLDFHRREAKPIWWRMFDRANATPDERRDDPGCIEGVVAVGAPQAEKMSMLQTYRFDPAQECKLAADSDASVWFAHNLDVSLTLDALDTASGTLALKIGKKGLREKLGGTFPSCGALLPNEYVNANVIATALMDVAKSQLQKRLPAPVRALLERRPPALRMQAKDESSLDAATRIALGMEGGCLVIQGPPGTGKTYTGARTILALLRAGKNVGISSNSRKAILNLISACWEAAKEEGYPIEGLVAGGELDADFLGRHPGLNFTNENKKAAPLFLRGIVGSTAWMFSLPDWEGRLDYLFIDEAGQVSLANAVAMARSARNLMLLGDQMQLEQPTQGCHPGDSGLSALQYALKDEASSREDEPAFHAVVPPGHGLFLGESRRMHPEICSFISESVYEGRLHAHKDCARQRIARSDVARARVAREHGLVFLGVEHEANVQQSDEEVACVGEVVAGLLGREYTDSDGQTRPLGLEDILVVAPYNAQVRALRDALPEGARVGSVDKFQGQEAPVCILSLCSSYGEYGSRGLAFILDRNRLNVAISRAQCLAVVVADPRIARADAANLDEMRLINLFCKIAATGRHALREMT